jgi:uncharacterized membrane protein YfcA
MLEPLGLFLFAFFVSLLAMMSGGEGAIFFVPLFSFLGLPPIEAIGTAFVTQFFGKSSGTASWFCVGVKEGQQQIQWKAVLVLVLIGIPFTLAGALLISYLPANWLKFIFGLIAILLAIVMAKSLIKGKRIDREDVSTSELLHWKNAIFCALAGLFTGMLAIGMGILNIFMLDRLNLKVRKVVATVVAVLPFTALLGLFVHWGYVRWDFAIFTIPGVLFGGFIGPWIATWLEGRERIVIVKIIFIILTLVVGWYMVYTAGLF